MSTNAATEPTGVFQYNRSNQKFEQAMVYFHIDRAQRYIQSLGFNNVQNRQQVAAIMTHWQQDSDLAGIRDEAALAKLSAEERAACVKLWSDVAALLKKTEEKAK